ncbi:hypothetical protein FMUND_13192 [Fusarium mundagurra]|uniref:Uncharacterized protein n=1 Tax=Fusarium mundagurra TaxID=1567541 RepID=A0A8H6D420_9HYPO|nr:hypothetical protein FMUND_13192 [Fusarium mundagurra]
MPVRLDDTAFGKPPAETMVFKLEEHLKTLKREYNTNWDLDNFGQRLATNTIKFWEDFLRVTNEPKIHAEIQLMWHLERHPSSKPPRVIASNKDACFLCNAFISFHGKYMIPKTHGRIYPGWRLPSTGLDETRGLFVRELERVAVERLDVINQQGFEKNIDPLESTISLVAISATSLNRSETKDMLPEMTATNTGINNEVLETMTEKRPAICLLQPTKHGQSKAGVKTETKNLAAESTKVSLIPRDSPISSQETIILAKESANEAEKFQEQAPISVEELNDTASKETKYELHKNTSPETYQTRPSSTYFPESKHSDHKPSDGPTTAWEQVKQDSTKRMKLNSFNLYIEYTSSDPNTSKVLKVKAKRLSVEEAAEVAEGSDHVYDLDSLSTLECDLGNCQQVKMKAKGEVYVVDLGSFGCRDE